MSKRIGSRLTSLFLIVCVGATIAACGWVKAGVRPDPPPSEQPRLAVLPFDMGIEITKLSAIQGVNGALRPEEEPLLIAKAVKAVREDARRLMYQRLEGKDLFTLVPLEDTDDAIRALGLGAGGELKPDQVARLRARLNVDLVVTGIVQDYGQVRRQWLAAGMLGDMTWESVALGAATSWNPIAIFANIGFELLTSTPVWFGGGYLFGVAFRPVRVEAWAVDPIDGESVWKETEVAIYAWGRLKELPEAERSKKEAQLGLNLKKAMEALADSLLDEGFTKTTLRERRLPVQDVVAF